MSDPNRYWDGAQWLRWDGTQWVGEAPTPIRRNPWPLILGIVAGVLAVALVGTVLYFNLNRQTSITPVAPSPSPTSPGTSSTPPAPTPAPVVHEFTTYYVATSQGQAWGAGVKTKGDRMSGWVGALQTDDLTCFNGVVSGGKLRGVQVTPPYADSPATKQDFSWPVSGSGSELRLIEIGALQSLREVPVAVLNQQAGQGANESWQRLFDLCAGLTGGLS